VIREPVKVATKITVQLCHTSPKPICIHISFGPFPHSAGFLHSYFQMPVMK